MSKPNIYTVGGAVQAGGGLYIQRQADNDLLKLCREGAFAYVLTSRQVGKSSLMVRAAEKLAEEGIRSVIVDLTVFGVQITAEAWYLGLLTAISDRLNLSTDVVEWWRRRAQFGDTQRLTEFFQNVLLAEVKERVVVFIDEIDSTLSLPAANGQPFTDDFYAAIRYLYNARATVPDFRRLSFVLIGVATPGDLIRDPKRTPFNIGSRVDITDFTFNEALPLAEGLELPTDNAQQVLRWVIKWTGGHPYLTQRLCRVVAEQYRSNWNEEEINRTVANTFFGKMSEHDNNLQFVRDMLTRRAPDKLAVLSTYKDIRLSRMPVRDEEQSPIKSHLKLSGVVKREDGKLHVRNPIYRDVFDKGWIQDYWPVSWWATIPKPVKMAGGIAAILLIASVISLVLFVQEQKKALEANQRVLTREQQLAQEQAERRQEADSLAKAERAARTEADKRTKEAEHAQRRAENYAQAEASARADADVQRQRAEDQALLAKMQKTQADSARQAAETRRKEVERLHLLDVARALMVEAPRQQQGGQHELGALLARQAYLFNKENDGNLQDQIYETLQTILNTPYFSSVVGRFENAINSIAFNRDGYILAAGSEDGILRLWDLRKPGADPLVVHASQAGIGCMAFSPDDKTLALGCADGSVKLWNWRQSVSNPILLSRQSAGIRAIAFSPDGQFLAVGSENRKVLLWDTNSLSATPEELPGQESAVWSLAFSIDGKTICTGGGDGILRLWDLRQPLHTEIIKGLPSVAVNLLFPSQQSRSAPKQIVGHEGGIKTVAFSPDGSRLVSGGTDGVVRIWELRESSLVSLSKLVHDNGINAAVFSSDGQTLATASADQNVRLWNLRQPNSAPPILSGHIADVKALAINSKSNLLASASIDGTVRLWDLETATNVPLVLRGHTGWVRAVVSDPQGKMVASGSEDKTVRLWNLDQPTVPPIVLRGYKSGVRSVAFSPNGKTLASGTDLGNIQMWHSFDSDSKPTILNNNSPVWAVAFSLDGQTLASGGANGIVRLWDLGQDSITTKYSLNHEARVRSLFFSQDGNTLASSGDNGNVRIWTLHRQNATLLAALNHPREVYSIVFSPDGKMLASGCDDGKVRIWDLDRLNTPRMELSGHESFVSSIAFSPDGTTLASGSGDGTIRLWNLSDPSRRPLVLRGHESWVWSVAFSPNGEYIVSGSGDKTVRVWPTRLDKLADEICKKVWRNMTQQEWHEYVGAGINYESTCDSLPPDKGKINEASGSKN